MFVLSVRHMWGYIIQTSEATRHTKWRFPVFTTVQQLVIRRLAAFAAVIFMIKYCDGYGKLPSTGNLQFISNNNWTKEIIGKQATLNGYVNESPTLRMYHQFKSSIQFTFTNKYRDCRGIFIVPAPCIQRQMG